MNQESISTNPFEARLEAVFRPVRPSNHYVQAIRRRIITRSPVEISRRIHDRSSILMILGGILSASLLILTVARAFFYFTSHSKL